MTSTIMQRMLDHSSTIRQWHVARDDTESKKDDRLTCSERIDGETFLWRPSESQRVLESLARQLCIWWSGAIDVARHLWRSSDVVWRVPTSSVLTVLGGFSLRNAAGRWREWATGPRPLSIAGLARRRQNSDGGRRIQNELQRQTTGWVTAGENCMAWWHSLHLAMYICRSPSMMWADWTTDGATVSGVDNI